MKSFALEGWDDGRLTVNSEFAETLLAADLRTFAALMQFVGGRVAKNVLRERTTTRIELPGAGGTTQAFYLKRHLASPWREHVKPWLRLRRPILGAGNEWNAILAFHAADIPTMTPVALGESGSESFLLTQSIDGCRKLSQWMDDDQMSGGGRFAALKQTLLRRVAHTARRMHGAGLHHQDFYLGHLMAPEDDPAGKLFVIDLGRVRRYRRLGTRWIVKDLAQLNYSAPHFAPGEKRRFLEEYLARPLGRADRRLIRRIERKTEAIARHSRKNRL